MDKTLEGRWNEMTFGTYLAIQNVLENPEIKKFVLEHPKLKELKKPVLNNGYAFRLLCELAFKRDDNGIGLTDLVKLGPEALNALEYLLPTGLITYTDGVTISLLGKIFMREARKEVNKYLGRDLPDYARN